MAVIKWSKEMELGIPEIDKQHKKLVDMLDEFYRELKEENKEVAVKKFFKNLEDYLNYHLTFEEKFLEKLGYPETEMHKKTHDLFKKLYFEEKERFLKKGDYKAIRELVALTFSWLYTHIMKTDKKYAKFIHEKYKKIHN